MESHQSTPTPPTHLVAAAGLREFWGRLLFVIDVLGVGQLGITVVAGEDYVEPLLVLLAAILLTIGYYLRKSKSLRDSIQASSANNGASIVVAEKLDSLQDLLNERNRPVVDQFLGLSRERSYFHRNFATLSVTNDGSLDVGNLVADCESASERLNCYWLVESERRFVPGNEGVPIVAGQTRQLVIAQTVMPTAAWAKLPIGWESSTALAGIGLGDDHGAVISLKGDWLNIMRVKVKLTSSLLREEITAHLAFRKKEPIIFLEKESP
jgi:hypothetical protein